MKSDSFLGEERDETGLPQHQTPQCRCFCQIKLSTLPFLVNGEKEVVSTKVVYLEIHFVVTNKCSRRAPVGPGSHFQAAYGYFSYPRASETARADRCGQKN